MSRRTLWIRPGLQPDRSEAICRLCRVSGWSLALVTAMLSPLLSPFHLSLKEETNLMSRLSAKCSCYDPLSAPLRC